MPSSRPGTYSSRPSHLARAISSLWSAPCSCWECSTLPMLLPTLQDAASRPLGRNTQCIYPRSHGTLVPMPPAPQLLSIRLSTSRWAGASRTARVINQAAPASGSTPSPRGSYHMPASSFSVPLVKGRRALWTARLSGPAVSLRGFLEHG